MLYRARLTVLFFVLLIVPIFGMGALALDYSADAMVSDLERSVYTYICWQIRSSRR
jgi:hypothetical protein